MAKKIAVFVEGLTEQEFTIRLLQELAGKRGVAFEIFTQYTGILSFTELRSNGDADIHVLVANCCTDGQVKTQIKDRYNHLKSLGFSLIIGLRDVHPLAHNEIKDLEKELLTGILIDPVPVHIHLAVMETEAWFLEELTHFERIDSKITNDKIIKNGFDFSSVRAYSLINPANVLDNIYKSVGKRYVKRKRHIQRTVDALSYEELYVNTQNKNPQFKNFVTSLETCLN